MKKHLTPCDTSSEKLACLTYKTNKFKHADTPLRTASDTWSKIAVEIFFLHPPGFQAVGASYCTPPRTLHHPQHGRTARGATSLRCAAKSAVALALWANAWVAAAHRPTLSCRVHCSSGYVSRKRDRPVAEAPSCERWFRTYSCSDWCMMTLCQSCQSFSVARSLID